MKNLEDNEIKKAFVFGVSEDVLRKMSLQLQKERFTVATLADETRLEQELAKVDPDIILCEFNLTLSIPMDQLVKNIYSWMRNRGREINKMLNSPSSMTWERSKVILYKTEVPIEVTAPVGEQIADSDDMMSKCVQLGNVQYLGIYSSWSFVGKLRTLLQNE